MNRISTTLVTVSAFLCPVLGAAEPTVQALESKITSLETRVVALESLLEEKKGAYSYQNTATLEATKGTPAPGSTAVSSVTSASTIPAPTIPAAPAAPAAAATAPAGPGQTYVIQDGDTLGKIAAKFGIERKSLLEANRLGEGQPIYIGETLMIPGAGATAATQAPAPTSGVVADSGQPAPAKQESKVVGETKQPAPATTKSYTVGKGDTLTSVAKKHQTTVESLKTANGLRSDTISLGQVLKIPAAKSGTASAPSAPASAPAAQTTAYQYDNPLLKSDETYGQYSVVKGDNLYALARDFFTTMSELQRINNLGASTVIHPGDEIIVPTSKYNAYHKTGQVTSR